MYGVKKYIKKKSIVNKVKINFKSIISKKYKTILRIKRITPKADFDTKNQKGTGG